jgi:site-specific DNA-methyltransferase (cytosine-N4-specific)
MTSTVTLHIGDVRDVMATLPDNGFDMLVTSPPFLALRSYLPADHPDKHREIGSEPTPAAFLDTLYGLTEDWGRLLPEWASICVELGDTMSGAAGYGNPDTPPAAYASKSGERYAERWEGRTAKRFKKKDDGWPLAKSMCLLPHLYTIGLAYGHNPLTAQTHGAGQWRIRNVITWARPNPPVGSLGKRNPEKRTGDYKFRPACSFITVACRGTGRYFDLDAVRTAHRTDPTRYTGNGYSKGIPEGIPGNEHMPGNPAGAPPLDWHTDHLDGDWLWKLATAPYKGAHYATYPLTLPRRLILAMCPSRVCRECGWPSERVTTPTKWDHRTHPLERTDRIQRGGLGTHGDRRASPMTTGWTDCGCSPTMIDDSQDGERFVIGEADYAGLALSPAVTDEGVALQLLDGRSEVVEPVLRHRERETVHGPHPKESGVTGPGPYRTGHVLDPFGGSGTTAVAAAIEGRDATLIDLDPRNVDLVRRRLTDHCRILDEQRDGDTIVWTVEPVSRPELDAIAAGQMELFG